MAPPLFWIGPPASPTDSIEWIPERGVNRKKRGRRRAGQGARGQRRCQPGETHAEPTSERGDKRWPRRLLRAGRRRRAQRSAKHAHLKGGVIAGPLSTHLSRLSRARGSLEPLPIPDSNALDRVADAHRAEGGSREAAQRKEGVPITGDTPVPVRRRLALLSALR